ncbi:ZIP family metal transporter [Aurantiacibacter zhengii]|nr:zinc transporter [Aurantiacibacter zhengii]
MVLIVVLVVSGALVAGAVWGAYGSMGKQTEGFLVALAGGALLLSVTTELIEPAVERAGLSVAALAVATGAGLFTGIDYLVSRKWGSDSGGGLLASITLDGIPENLALGVALIGAGAPEVAALAGSILLSNLPEAAGGAKQMAQGRMSKGKVIALWAATAALLSVAAIAGNILLANVGEGPLSFIRGLAAGAVVASLATEVFPQGFKDDHHWAGIATALGLLAALALGQLGSG